MNNIDIAWLAGIIDGEGSVSFQVTFRKTGNISVVPFIIITNSDHGILDNAKRILDENDIKHDRQHQVKKHIFTIRVSRQEAINKLIKLIGDYLHSFKKHNIQVLQQFIEMRKESLPYRKPDGKFVFNMYTEEQLKLIQTIRTRCDGHKLEKMLSASNVLKNKI